MMADRQNATTSAAMHEHPAPPPDGGSEPDDRQIILAVRRGWAYYCRRAAECDVTPLTFTEWLALLAGDAPGETRE